MAPKFTFSITEGLTGKRSGVERVAKDPVYWVRREASYTLGALSKVAPVGTVVSSLVSIGIVESVPECLNPLVVTPP